MTDNSTPWPVQLLEGLEESPEEYPDFFLVQPALWPEGVLDSFLVPSRRENAEAFYNEILGTFPVEPPDDRCYCADCYPMTHLLGTPEPNERACARRRNKITVAERPQAGIRSSHPTTCTCFYCSRYR